MNSRVSWFGIDFGTTNSAAFSFTGIDENSIEPIHYGDDEGRPFPSIVAIDKTTGEIVTGREAKERRNVLRETHEYFDSIKTILDSDQSWEIAGKKWKPEDVAAEILSALKNRVEKNNKQELDEAVLAVPIGYSAEKKARLRKAAKKAGINVKMFVSEPTAAFCSNYDALKSCKYVAVFDWGGGTLDVVIIKTDGGDIIELASDGMPFAGNDIDLKLAEKMHAKFARKKNVSIPFSELDPYTKDQLLTKCEKAKCDFEDEDVVNISINRYGELGSVRESLEYDYFSLLLEKDVEKAVSCLTRAIKTAGLNIQNIDRILCVGGSSKLRPLQEKLEETFGEDMLLYPERVMWDIAKGASIVSLKSGGYRLSKSIGLELSNGDYFPLLREGQNIPCEELSLSFSIVDQAQDGPKEARFIFTDSDIESNRDLYEPMVLPLRGFMDEYIRLSCYVDQDNVFKVKLSSTRVSESLDRMWKYDRLKLSFHVGA